MISRSQPTSRLLSIADLQILPTDLPSGPIDYELDNGRLGLVAPFDSVRGATRANLAARLFIDGQQRGHGKARGRVAIVLSRNPDCVLTPDAAFIATKSLPVRTSEEDYLETIPELVVEVRSKNDSLEYVRRKVVHYLKARVEIVWVVDPAAKSVTIHQTAAEPVTLGIADTLQCGDLIPEFSLPVVDVFRE